MSKKDFAKFLKVFIKWRNLDISDCKSNYIFEIFRSRVSKLYI